MPRSRNIEAVSGNIPGGSESMNAVTPRDIQDLEKKGENEQASLVLAVKSTPSLNQAFLKRKI